MSELKGTLRPIDEPHYRYWQALYYSFFNPKLYVDVGKRWKGFCILYLFLLMSIAIIPFFYSYMIIFQNYFDNSILKPLESFPVLYLQDGQLSMNKESPYLIKNKKNQVVAIIDTSGKTTEFTEIYPQLIFLVTKDKLMIRPPQIFFSEDSRLSVPSGSIITNPFPKTSNEIFNAKEWVLSKNISKFKWISSMMLYPTLLFSIFAFYLVFLFALAFMAQLVAKILIKVDLRYTQAFRLLMVSATPQIFVLFIMSANNWIFSGFGILMIALLAVYFSFAALALKRESHKLVRS